MFNVIYRETNKCLLSVLKLRLEVEVKANIMQTTKFSSHSFVNIENNEQERTTNVLKTSRLDYILDRIHRVLEPSYSKLTVKLIGGKKAIEKEQRRMRLARVWIIHPLSAFRYYWDLCMVIFLVINLVVLPVAITFFNSQKVTGWVVFNSASDAVFIIDILINFRTGILCSETQNEIVLNGKEIAKTYVKKWFILDFISSLPFDYVMLAFQLDAQLIRGLKVLRLAKLLSLLRLLRLSRLMRYATQWEELIDFANKFVRVFNFVCLMLLFAHWGGCIQFLVPSVMDFPHRSWVALNELQFAHWFEQYTWSLFKAMSHMICIGYGRFPPQSLPDVWLTIFSMILGATCYAIILGHATAVIGQMDSARRQFREKLQQVNEYMIYRKLPTDLRERINDYLDHRYQGTYFDEDGVLRDLSGRLREEVISFNCRPLVAAVPAFENSDPNFFSDVLARLQYHVVQPGDVIMKYGTMGDKMYFIQEGIVEICSPDGQTSFSLSDGEYFGEICLLTRTPRVATARAATYCKLFSLSYEHFNDVIEEYPGLRKNFEKTMSTRLDMIGLDSEEYVVVKKKQHGKK